MCAPDRKEMINVAEVALRNRVDLGVEMESVLVRQGPPTGCPPGEQGQARTKNRRLHLVQPTIDAGEHVLITAGAASVAKSAHGFGHG